MKFRTSIYSSLFALLACFCRVIFGADNLCVDGEKQSPVDVNEHSTTIDGLIKYEHYADAVTLVVHSYKNITASSKISKNITVNVTTTSEQLPIYIFHHMHLRGCGEHSTADERNKYFELHLVHYNSEQESYDVAKTVPRGLLIIAVLIKEGGDDNVAMCHIWELFHNTTNKLKDVTLKDFLPKNMYTYYIYDGSSITDDNCDEVVTWMVAQEIVLIADKQLLKLQTEINDTCKDIKLLGNSRAVFLVNFSSGESVCKPHWLIILILIVSFLCKKV